MKNFNTFTLLFILSFINSIGLSQKSDTSFVILKKTKRVLKRKNIVFCFEKKIKAITYTKKNHVKLKEILIYY